jgi:hypothetical protein
MIGPGGLLLVVPHLFADPVSLLLVGLQKSRELNWDVKNIFAGSHTDHRWRCSNIISKNNITNNIISKNSIIVSNIIITINENNIHIIIIIIIINQKTPRTTSSTTTSWSSTTTFMMWTKSSFSLSLPAHFKIRMLPTHVHAPHFFKSTAK